MTESLLYPTQTSKRQIMDLGGMWKFKFDIYGDGKDKGYPNGLSDYELMPVPSSYNDYYTEKEKKEHGGDVWYETFFFTPLEWADKDILLRFAGVSHTAEVFLNGVSVTIHEGGFLPFECNINNFIKLGEKVRLVVRVNNELSNITLPVGKTIVDKDGKKKVMPNFDFFNYAGIHRPVKLMALPQIRVQDVSVKTFFDKDENGITGYVDYKIQTNGEHVLTDVILYDESGQESASSKGEQNKLIINDVVLWKIHKGYLYTMRIIIRDKDGHILDEYEQKIGIRTIEIVGSALLLNGEKIYLKGFGKHEDAEITGRGYNPAVNKRDFELMKWCGANSFRTSHYPYSEEMLQMADEEGFLVISEVAAVGMQDFEGNWQNPDCDTSKRFFGNREVQTKGLENHICQLRQLIARDKNHPSVIMWSVMNEPDCSDKDARPYYEAVFTAAKDEDPQKRPCSFSNHTMVERDCAHWDLCDILMLNKYYGWYIKGGIEIDSAMDALREELKKWKAAGKPILISEFGADAIAGLHELPGVLWSEEYQTEFLERNCSVFDEFNYIIGEHIWNFADFQTAEALHRTDGNRKGIFTRSRQPKMAAYFIRKRWKLI